MEWEDRPMHFLNKRIEFATFEYNNEIKTPSNGLKKRFLGVYKKRKTQLFLFVFLRFSL